MTRPADTDHLLRVAEGHAVKRLRRIGLVLHADLVEDVRQEFVLGALSALTTDKAVAGEVDDLESYQMRAGVQRVNGFLDWFVRRRNSQRTILDAPDATGKQAWAETLPADTTDPEEHAEKKADAETAWQLVRAVTGGIALKVLELRFREGLDKTATGKRLNLSAKVVARVERDALEEAHKGAQHLVRTGAMPCPLRTLDPKGDMDEAALLELVAALPQRDAEAIRLRFVEHLSRAEIARRQDTTSADSSTREARAVRKLKRLIAAVRQGQPLAQAASAVRPATDGRNDLETKLAPDELARRIDSLPDALRETMRLHVLRRMNKAETARRLGVARKTVRDRVRRAWEMVAEAKQRLRSNVIVRVGLFGAVTPVRLAG